MRWVALVCVAVGCGKDVRTVSDAREGSDIDAPRATRDAASDAAPDATPATLDCASYCNLVTSACTGANAQYDSAAHCLTTCAQITNAGTLTDMAGNTLGCRIVHAQLAQTTPLTHCQHAGPSGGGMCGTRCEAACDLLDDLCPAANWSNCASDCPTTGVAFTGPYSTTTATSAPKDTVECRLFYATASNCTAAKRTGNNTCK